VTVDLPDPVSIFVREFDKFFLCMHLGLEPAALYGVLHAPASFLCAVGRRPKGLISIAQTRMVHLEAQVLLLTSGAGGAPAVSCKSRLCSVVTSCGFQSACTKLPVVVFFNCLQGACSVPSAGSPPDLAVCCTHPTETPVWHCVF